MSRPLLLDLFCGAGGAAAGYHRAGFDVIGIDDLPQPHYPFEFIQGDAMCWTSQGYRHDLPPFDAIHASPPCQSFTAYRRKNPEAIGNTALDLIEPTRQILKVSGVPYVIENVPGAPLQDPTTLCGSSFGLDVRRHRLFETNWHMDAPPCNHSWQMPRFAPATNRTNPRSTVEVGVWRIPLDVQREAMGIEWMNRAELSQAIPPAYTEFIGRQLIEQLDRKVVAA